MVGMVIEGNLVETSLTGPLDFGGGGLAGNLVELSRIGGNLTEGPGTAGGIVNPIDGSSSGDG